MLDVRCYKLDIINKMKKIIKIAGIQTNLFWEDKLKLDVRC